MSLKPSLRRVSFWAGAVALLWPISCGHAPESPPQGWEISSRSEPRADWIQEEEAPSPHFFGSSPSYAELLRHEVRKEGKELRRCYLKELETDPKLYGSMSIRFLVDADGSVKEPRVDFSTLSSPALEPCVLEIFSSLKLPKAPKPDFSVRYPIVFTSEFTPPEVRDALIARYKLEQEVKAPRKAPQKPDDDKAPW